MQHTMGKSCMLVASVLLLIIHISVCRHGEEHKSANMIRCKRHELDALLKFKKTVTKDPMSRLSSWVGEDCCQWVGLRCDNVTNNVIKLILRDKPLNSDVCVSDNSLVFSEVSPALLELKYLRHLDLSGNDFSGSQIPEFIGSMTHLRYLNLSRTGFTGPIPSQLGNLTRLRFLDLHAPFQCVMFSGLNSESLRWASGLSKLQWLDLGSCSLAEAYDTFQVLVSLPSLSFLSLAACQLPYGQFPEAVFANTSNSNFRTLENLDLSYNNLKGTLPSVLKNMVSLKSLNLNFNNFNGSIPLWLKNLKQLEILKLRVNGFTHVDGGVWGILGNPCNFKHLDLSNNAIVQQDILETSFNSSRCAAYDFEYLGLSDNKLGGSLPSLLGELINLQHLDLSSNGFGGKIPTSLAKLSDLTHLDLSVNRLSGLIPDFVGHLTKIEHLDISSNTIHGTVYGIGNLSKLSFLDLSFNNLKLDSSFNWRPRFTLEVFRVHSCKINTGFPLWLRNQTQIERLDLSYTGISGELPQWLWNMSNLQTLQLSGNQHKGSLPSHIFCNGCNLWLLDLHSNLLSGSIPHWLSHLETIEVIDLSGNKLSGEIFAGENASSFLTGKNSLEVLDLGDNMFSGKIHFGHVYPDAPLKILTLRGNNFIGPIHSQLCHFQLLRVLELGHNRLTGHIPRCLGSLQFDSNTGGLIGQTGLQIIEVIKGIKEVFAGTKGTHSIIDLSSNYLTGTIPEELTNISKLAALNLSNNHLTGSIPQEIGNLNSLESLDLSNNQLSGIIPQSLSAIPWLSSLNLSNNKLHGQIPTGSQLQTLDNPSIYAGNSGLCGFPLPNKCSNQPPSDGDGDDKDEDEKADKWLYLSIFLGVVTGFWGFVGFLVLNRSWRHAYFSFVKKHTMQFKARVNRFRNKF
ncbi:hypothetical protein RND81_13G151700 [Saponaria officinalis]|uniref:Leucine-rich repeat-containing N-terminal plant-type domain-containing protein n=1 Tax=Saponaria officinalis TaxID=3572 RepID=A0AAW1GY97_SAPOF